ncbi:MAG: hypothetical protein AB7F28_08435 [Candidatus Margulisiibacteriota bacterium]
MFSHKVVSAKPPLSPLPPTSALDTYLERHIHIPHDCVAMVVSIGCGQARDFITVIKRFPSVLYVGVDEVDQVIPFPDSLRDVAKQFLFQCCDASIWNADYTPACILIEHPNIDRCPKNWADIMVNLLRFFKPDVHSAPVILVTFFDRCERNEFKTMLYGHPDLRCAFHITEDTCESFSHLSLGDRAALILKRRSPSTPSNKLFG